MTAPDDPHADPQGIDDLPRSYLDDDEYEAFLTRELDAGGRLRGEPRVGFWIGVGIVVLVVLALWLFL